MKQSSYLVREAMKLIFHFAAIAWHDKTMQGKAGQESDMLCHAVKVVSDTLDEMSKAERDMAQTEAFWPAQREDNLRHRMVVRLRPEGVCLSGDRCWHLLLRVA